MPHPEKRSTAPNRSPDMTPVLSRSAFDEQFERETPIPQRWPDGTAIPNCFAVRPEMMHLFRRNTGNE